jgi:hypothetical protein
MTYFVARVTNVSKIVWAASSRWVQRAEWMAVWSIRKKPCNGVRKQGYQQMFISL